MSMSSQSILQWLVSFLIPAIIVELIRRTINQKGPKLIYYSSGVVSHRIMPRLPQNPEQPAVAPVQPFWLNSVVLTLQNNGNLTAHNIEISHPQAPENVQLSPAIEHSVVYAQDSKRMTIKISSLAPKETVAISYLFGPIANWNDLLEYIRSDDGLAKKMNVNLLRVFPGWFNRLMLGFTFLGLVFLGIIIWWLYPPIVAAIQWLVKYPR